MGKKIGIFGGTFDPVHLGHVAIVVALAEAHRLDHVYIIPANVNPYKCDARSSVSAIHRLQMLKRAFKSVPRTSILSLEIERDGPSYTIDTVKQLLHKNIFHSSDSHFLLIGQDQLERFCLWKDVHELITIASPLIARRSGSSLEGDWSRDSRLKKVVDEGLTQTALMDISATDIRLRMKQGLFCGHLLDSSVLKYIQKHQLYHE